MKQIKPRYGTTLLFKKVNKENGSCPIYKKNMNKQIHKYCCKRCPTNNFKGIKDHEIESIKLFPKEVIAKEFLFVCAWRSNKLCKGICDEFQINQEFINNL